MAASTSGKPAAVPEQDEIEIKKLNAQKIKDMMRRDPKFIGRLIGQLDTSMHNMIRQKQQRVEQIAADQAELDALDAQIASHIQPHIDRLHTSIREKSALRKHLEQQIEAEFGNLKALEANARALIQSTRISAGGLMRKTAAQRMEEARGFSTSMPTTTLIRGSSSSSTKGSPAGTLKRT